ncbi:MAG: hypothetical protein JXC32_18895 [Anaerolineae bacterium]|nr:hypothetical protein [Anaerolineae bacterium]
MPIQYIVLDHGMLVYARAHGTLTREDLLAHERNVLQDKCISRGYKQLLDCRWVKEDLVDSGVVAALTELHAQHKSRINGSRYAIVTHNAAWFQVGSQYDCDHFGMTMIVFNDPSTACIWLGVDYRDIAQYGWFDVSLATPRRSWVARVSTI